MPTLKKLLSKFDGKEREILEFLVAKIISLDWRDLDVKKLKGYRNVFRVRKGQLRIIFSRDGNTITIFSIDRRSETTYKF